MTMKREYFDYLEHFGRTIPLRELHAHPEWENAIALRHDIDHDLDLALEMAHHEHNQGIRSTYYALPGACYWDDPDLGIKLQQLEAYGHEVGLHVNLLTEWTTGRIDDLEAGLRQLLGFFRSLGLNVTGTSAHGDKACYRHGFINYWIWKELRPADPLVEETGRTAEGIPATEERWRIEYPQSGRLAREDGCEFACWSVSLGRYGLDYDAFHVPHDTYWTDSGGRWTRSPDPLESDLRTGRHQVLIHPCWWRETPKTVFVLSTARSGSRWLANFVEKATSAHGVHEWTLNHSPGESGMQPDKRTDFELGLLLNDRSLARTQIAQALKHFRSLKPKRDVLEANVYLEPFAEQLLDEEPQSILIHLHRNGRDVVRSLINRGWYDAPEDIRHPDLPIEGWDELSQFQRACQYYRKTNERLLSVCQSRLSFEKMVSDPYYLTKRLSAAGIIVHPLLAQRIFAQPINQNRHNGFPSYDQWPSGCQREFQRICGSIQAALGYPGSVKVQGATRSAELRALGFGECSSSWFVKLRERNSAEFRALGFSQRAEAKPSEVVVQSHCYLPKDGLLAGVLGPPAEAVDVVGLTRVDEQEGVRLETPEGRGSPYAIGARGRWSRVNRRNAICPQPNRYFRIRIEGAVFDPLTVRVFVLSLNASGQVIATRAIGRMRAGDGIWEFPFVPEADWQRFVPALHIGNQPPGCSFLRRLEVCSIPFPRGYRTQPAGLAVARAG